MSPPISRDEVLRLFEALLTQPGPVLARTALLSAAMSGESPASVLVGLLTHERNRNRTPLPALQLLAETGGSAVFDGATIPAGVAPPMAEGISYAVIERARQSGRRTDAEAQRAPSSDRAAFLRRLATPQLSDEEQLLADLLLDRTDLIQAAATSHWHALAPELRHWMLDALYRRGDEFAARQIYGAARVEPWLCPYLLARIPTASKAPSLPSPQRDEAPPTAPRDYCYFSVRSASWIAPGQPAVVEVWCHSAAPEAFFSTLRARGEQEALGSSGPHGIERNVWLDILMRMDGFDIEEPAVRIRWHGWTGVGSFLAKPHSGLTAGVQTGSVDVSVDGLRIARVYFQVQIGAPVDHRVDCTAGVERLRTAFASYATEDRERVLARLQGMVAALPDLDIFLDAGRLPQPAAVRGAEAVGRTRGRSRYGADRFSEPLQRAFGHGLDATALGRDAPVDVLAKLAGCLCLRGLRSLVQSGSRCREIERCCPHFAKLGRTRGPLHQPSR